MDMNDNVISKADLWADRIHAFQESGLSRKDWCQQNEIPQSTLNELLDPKDPVRGPGNRTCLRSGVRKAAFGTGAAV